MCALAATVWCTTWLSGQVSASQPALAVPETIVVATSADYPPMEYLSDGRIVGHDITLMNALAAKMGVTVVYTDVLFVELLPGLQAGRFDAAIATLERTPERLAKVDFTVPYALLAGDENVAIALPKDSGALRRLFHRALWLCHADGTLGSIVTAIGADRPDWVPQIPRWMVIGAAQALSGDSAALGWRQLNAAELAAEQANALGGVTLGGQAYDVLVAPADSACSSARAGQAANQLISGGAVAVLGHSCDAASFAAQPLYDAAGVAMVSASSIAPGVTQQGYDTTFRTVSKGDAAAVLLAEQLYGLGGARRAAIIERSTFARSYAADAFAERFKQLGGTITHRRVVNASSEYGAVLSEILAANPDALYYADDDASGAGSLSRLAHDMGHSEVAVAWDPVWDGVSVAGALRNAYVAAAGPAAEGDYVGWLHRPTGEMPGYAALKADYQAAGFERDGGEPGLFGALAYDAVQLVLDAVRHADSLSPAEIREQIAAMPPWEGAAGRYEGFDVHGDVLPQRAWLERYYQGRWTRPVSIGLVVPFADAEDALSRGAYRGLQRAEGEWGILMRVYTATSEADWGTNLSRCAADGNALCVSASFQLEAATRNAASAHPDTYFAMVDAAVDSGPDNLSGITLSLEEAGYLAGNLAGWMTDSGTIGVIGGDDVPAVRAYVQSFVKGARCANPGVAVRQTYADTFAEPLRGEVLAQAMITLGADVVFAPAGATGEGAVSAAAQAGVWGIGADDDYYHTVFDSGAVAGADKLLSSAMRRIDTAVYESIADLLSGDSVSGTVHYDLANGGVGLAPFHQADVPQSVRAELDRVRRAIINGTVQVSGPCVRPLGVGLIVPGATTADAGSVWSANQGLMRAETVVPVVGTVYTATAEAEWAAKAAQCVADGNALCIAVGAELSETVRTAASGNPGTYFAIVDSEVAGGPENLRGLVFAEDEVGYLAGMLAGLKTQSNRVGVIAGQMDDGARRFVQGYRHGALCHNPHVLADVRYAGPSSDAALGAEIARQMIANGVDVIFAPAGVTGQGALLHAVESGSWAIGGVVDTYEALFGGGAVAEAESLLTSALKRVDDAVLETISDVLYDRFASGTVRYDLSNGGVGLAPFHEAEADIPQAVRDQLESVEQDIVDGAIDVRDSCREPLYLPLVVRSAT
jgi:basic membrane lipoprotein Med (substrate-binding protein (PBP1-ABC) superfamily)/ABC-type branched-subunit amino acid transport system substrate-binding protein